MRRSRDFRYGISVALDQINALRLDPGDAVVVSGFWRSGTTWLQGIVSEALNAKPVFEPFQMRAGYLPQVLQLDRLPRRDYAYLSAFMPYCNGMIADTSLGKLISAALKGRLAHPYVHRTRNDVLGSIAGKVVVKFTKGALCLEGIQRTYDPAFLHVYRDPRAVLASLKRFKPLEEYNARAFSDLYLSDHFLRVEDGRKKYFDRWRREIEAIDKMSLMARVTGYWALTERFVEDWVAQGGTEIQFVQYERAVTDGEDYLASVLGRLRPSRSLQDFSKTLKTPSSSTYGRRKSASGHQRMQGWKTELSEEQKSQIADVAEMFGLEGRLT